jgi:carboxylesterase
MTHPILAGAEPFSAPGPNGDAVLVVHGFTGSPGSVRRWAQAFADAGYAVELPLLPGHGTDISDMLPTRWSDWCQAAEAAYLELAGRSRRMLIAGLSMGGALTVWLAARHPEISGVIVVNPIIDPPADSFRDVLRGVRDAGESVVPGIGSDIADPNEHELSYAGTPVEPALSLFEGLDALAGDLASIRCPVLLFTSRNDHVVPPVSSDVLAGAVSGPVERVFLDRSYHVATMDYDRADIEARSLEFAAKVLAG